MSNERKLLMDAATALELLVACPTNREASRRAQRLAALIKKELGVAESGFYAAASGRGSVMFVAKTGKWTKFPELARLFESRDAAQIALDSQLANWQTRHMWKTLVMTSEELHSFKVMEALR